MNPEGFLVFEREVSDVQGRLIVLFEFSGAPQRPISVTSRPTGLRTKRS